MKRWWQLHPTAGNLRAYLDLGLRPARQARLAAHLHTCPACQSRLRELEQAATRAAALVSRLQAETHASPIPPIRWEEAYPMTAPWRHTVPYASMAAALALLIAVVTVPGLRAVAADWLSVFRTEKIAVVQVEDPSFVGQTVNTLRGKITPELARRLGQVEGPAHLPDFAPATAEQAANLVGTLRQPAWLPAGLAAQPTRLDALTPVLYTLHPDVDAINAFLAQQGVPARLASQLKGATFRVTTPAAVARFWQQEGKTLAFIQGSGPQVEGSGAVDLQAMADMLAQLAGVPGSVMEQVRAIPDLGRTLVLPVAPGSGEAVTVAGQPGVWYKDSAGSGGLLLWQQAGRTYLVGGDYPKDVLLRVIGE